MIPKTIDKVHVLSLHQVSCALIGEDIRLHYLSLMCWRISSVKIQSLVGNVLSKTFQRS